MAMSEILLSMAVKTVLSGAKTAWVASCAWVKKFRHKNSIENPEIKRALTQAYTTAFRRLQNSHKETHKFLKENLACQSYLIEQFQIRATLRTNELQNPNEITTHIKEKYQFQAPQDLENALTVLFNLFLEEISQQPELVVLQIVNLDRANEERLQGLRDAIGVDVDIRKTTSRAQAASHKILEGFQRSFKNGFEHIQPYVISEKTGHQVTFDELINAATTGTPLLIKGEPGIGKTTALLMLNEHSLKCPDLVSVYIPLSEWVAGRKEIFEYLIARFNTAPSLKLEHIRILAEYGRLSLILDGWNELGGDKLEQARVMLAQLQREYPRVGIIVTTRSQSSSPPLEQPNTFFIRGLTEQQRKQLIYERMSKAEADKMLEHIHTDVELGEITRNPLYLSIFLSLHEHGLPLPKTKEELFGLFVRSYEERKEHKEQLIKELNGYHETYLTNLAVDMHENSTTALERNLAAKSVTRTNACLIKEGLISAPFDPSAILSSLVSHHLIIHTGEQANGSIHFQHQQFQEWYASHYVEAQIRKAFINKDDIAKDQLRKIIDLPLWEEALLFAAERMGQNNNDSQHAVASVIEFTLEIDPILSAVMIRRAGNAVWLLICKSIIEFIGHWHVRGTIDRGLTFILASGRPEFSDEVWSIFGHADQQIRLRALRCVQPFNCSVLGPNWHNKYQNLPEKVRADIGAELAIHQATPEALDIALEMAKSASEISVKIAIMDGLEFRGAIERVQSILKEVPEDCWDRIACEVRPEKLHDNELHKKLCERKHQLLNGMAISDPRRQSMIFDLDRRGADVSELFFQELGRDDLEVANHKAEHWIIRAFEIDPQKTSKIVIKRMIDEKAIGYNWDKFVIGATTEEKSALLQKFLTGKPSSQAYNKILASILGAQEIKHLIQNLVELIDKIHEKLPPTDRSLNEEYQRIRDLLGLVNFTTLAQVIMEHPTKSIYHITRLTHILASHRSLREPNDGHVELPVQLIAKLRTKTSHWVDAILQTPNNLRGHLTDIVTLLGKIGEKEDISFVNKLLDLELTRYREMRTQSDAWFKNGRKGERPTDANNDYFNIYFAAFSNLVPVATAEIENLMIAYLSDANFDIHAASVLYKIYKYRTGQSDRIEQFGQFNFSKVKERRAELFAVWQNQPTHPFVIKILDHIKGLLNADATKNGYRVVRLAGIAASMNYGDRTEDIIAALSSDGNLYDKLFIFQNLTLSGQTLPASLILPIYDKVFEDWSKQGKPENNRYFVEDWLAFLSLGELSAEVIDRILSYRGIIRAPWQMRDVLNALGNSSSLEATTVLKKLCDVDVSMIDTPEWLKALSSLKTLEAGRLLLSILSNKEKLTNLKPSGGGHVFPDVLAAIINANPTLKAEVIGQMQSPSSQEARILLASTIEHIEDPEIVIASLQLISDAASPSIPNVFHRALEQWILQRVPVSPNSSSFYLKPNASQNIRKHLFEMMVNDPSRKKSAKELLEWIDMLRDEYGRPENEPRHPDIDSGLPWPMLEETQEVQESEVKAARTQT